MKTYEVDLHGYKAQLPILPLPNGVQICFFNLHGNAEMTEHCGKELAKMVADCDVLLTAESKGLQLTHVIARELGHKFYAVARKSLKLYMQDGLSIVINSSITTGKEQRLYISKHDADLLKGKKVGIIDDVVSTGNSLVGLEKLVELAGGIICKKAFVLAEGDAKDRTDICFLDTIPLL
ncbi:MAG: adenine phosphoribosyltransferase [Clostridia bacterium]|nr:adenine phosphoribosyltransferase [Clostridia bacterium]MBQ7914465.1 adenine phosphoribosyltransferase [Clostridia bacterium]MBQ8504966.1 adenine phosphoribosyltransferase [Clostridia bacterium]MBQ8771775.1 adenine phosphoribosyltransferase [Clostridia bacterium]MBQ9707118.1 adenine phosphoribosyltransferase [Clostridia bacterium]